MRDFNENTITQAVLDSFSKTQDPRLRELLFALVRHIHDFARETRLTFDEWVQAVEFLTKTGQMCTATRQEFILLSDTLGLSMLVDNITNQMPAGATETTVLGPFYVQGPPEVAHGADISGGYQGKPLYVEGRVTDHTGKPVADAIVDTWHADADGFYDVQHGSGTELAMRARLRTDADGRFNFWSIVPRYYPIPDDGPVGAMLKATGRHPFRPAHVHFMISAPGCATLTTHVFVSGDNYLDSDAVFGVKDSLIADFADEAPGAAPGGRTMTQPWSRLTYDFCLKQLGEKAAA